MVKIIDIDKLFDGYIASYVYANIGKIKPEEIEDKISVFYTDFGDKPLKELDGKTPNAYYRDFELCDLLECLKKHIKSGVAVSDFLCEAIIDKKDEEVFLTYLKSDDISEEFRIYLMNMLGEKIGGKTAETYIEYVSFDYPETVKDLATEMLTANATKVKDKILSAIGDASEDAEIRFCEVLSRSEKDQRIFDILIKSFLKFKDKKSLFAAYLGKYGDERAIPYLKEVAYDQKTGYADFEELRFAVEMLGGECEKERDFSKDEQYKKIKGGALHSLKRKGHIH